MNFLKTFWANHPITTHSLAAAVTTVAILYAAVPPFHALLVSGYAATPAWFHQVFAAALGIYAFYHGSTRVLPAIEPPAK